MEEHRVTFRGAEFPVPGSLMAVCHDCDPPWRMIIAPDKEADVFVSLAAQHNGRVPGSDDKPRRETREWNPA